MKGNFNRVTEGRKRISQYAWEIFKQEFLEKENLILGDSLSTIPQINQKTLFPLYPETDIPESETLEIPSLKIRNAPQNRIGIVICRFGEETSGGAEFLARRLAEELVPDWQVDILTTCALDYNSWKSVYPAGITQTSQGYRIIRFDQKEKNIQQLSDAWFKAFAPEHSPEDEIEWVQQMGPLSPDLFHYLQGKQEDYSLFLFIGYLWATSPLGMGPVAHKSILLPAAHHEPAIELGIYHKLLNSPQALIYLTPDEKMMVNQLLGNSRLDSEIIPLGLQTELAGNEESFRAKTGIHDPYLLYLGRVDAGKGCLELIHTFQEYKKRYPGPLKLVLAGELFMDIPPAEDVISLGFVDETVKGGALAAARILINPSSLESLSLVLLESWLCEVPVLVNGLSPVMKAQCLRSQGGLWYRNSRELMAGIKLLMEEDSLREELGESGKQYALSQDYCWDYLMVKFNLLVQRVIDNSQQENQGNVLLEYLKPAE